MKNKNIVNIFLLLLFATFVTAQAFDMSAEIRPRYEHKHGFKTLVEKDQGSANFISQRTRLNFNYTNAKIKVGVVLQNVRVWGDVSTLSSSDISSSYHQAWVQYSFNDKLSLKMGRQEIIYDDHRIFGSVGWAQQARSHDAFISKYKNGKHKVDFGLALNSNNQSGIDNLYTNVAGYKAFQYIWYHGDFNDVGISFLALNTGIEYPNADGIQIGYRQTIGPRLTYKSGTLSANAAFYIQTGKLIDTDVSASYYTVNASYKFANHFTIGAGLEYLSGKDQQGANEDVESFQPLFGTNHKFNGWMDYFYVGNHGGSVGLVDINFPISYAKDKMSVKIVPHLFSAAADVYQGNDVMDSSLGTEIDLNFGYKINKEVMFNFGYSVMLATETMEALKNGDSDESNRWGWVMFTFKPKLFTTAKSE